MEHPFWESETRFEDVGGLGFNTSTVLLLSHKFADGITAGATMSYTTYQS